MKVDRKSGACTSSWVFVPQVGNVDTENLPDGWSTFLPHGPLSFPMVHIHLRPLLLLVPPVHSPLFGAGFAGSDAKTWRLWPLQCFRDHRFGIGT